MSDTLEEFNRAYSEKEEWAREIGIYGFAEKLQRERDEAREQIRELIYIAERAVALAEIDFENDKFGVVTELRDALARIKEGGK